MARHQRQSPAETDVTLKSHEVYSLRSKLCVNFGFCLPQTTIDELATNPPGSIYKFVETVLEAEGLDFQTADGDLRNEVWDLVARSFVASVSAD